MNSRRDESFDVIKNKIVTRMNSRRDESFDVIKNKIIGWVSCFHRNISESVTSDRKFVQFRGVSTTCLKHVLMLGIYLTLWYNIRWAYAQQYNHVTGNNNDYA